MGKVVLAKKPPVVRSSKTRGTIKKAKSPKTAIREKSVRQESCVEMEEPMQKEEEPTANTQEEPSQEEAPLQPTMKLYLGNLDASTTIATLRQHFAPYGTINHITLPWQHNDHINRGFAYIIYATEEDARAVMAVQHEVDGQTLEVKDAKTMAPIRTKKSSYKSAYKKHKIADEVFVGGLKHSTPPREVERHFGQFGKVYQVTMPRHKVREGYAGFAFVAFLTPREVLEATDEREQKIDGQDVIVVPAKDAPRKVHKRTRTITPLPHQLYIEGLNFKTSAEALTEHFAQFGAVVRCNIPAGYSNKEGFAYVAFEGEEAMEAALKQSSDGHMLNGRRLSVRRSKC